MSDDWSRRGFLLAAIEDTEGTIRATDVKASIALVLHGILFAGILATARASGRTFQQAADGEQFALAASLGIAACAFLISVIQLLRVVLPAPVKIIPDTPAGSTNRFFVTPISGVSALSGHPKMPLAQDFNERLATLTESEADIELGYELLKLAAIRSRKTRLAESGFSVLMVEVGSGFIFLGALAWTWLT